MEDLYKYENELYAKGLEYIGGVDSSSLCCSS